MKNKYHLHEMSFYIAVTVFCIFFGFFSAQMPFGRLSKPGQGFFPTILSVMGAVLAALAAWGAYRKGKLPEAASEEPGVDFSGTNGIGSLLMYVAMILFFILFAEIIGAYVCLAIMIFVLAKIQKLPGILKPALLSICSITMFYLLFDLFLGVALPSGFLL